MKSCQHCGMTLPDDALKCASCGAPAKPEPAAPAQKPNTEVLFEYQSLTRLVTVRVYPNRVAIDDKRGGFKAGFNNKTDILIRNITGVNIKGFKRNLELTMNDGSLREIPEIYGKHSEKAREVILNLL